MRIYQNGAELGDTIEGGNTHTNQGTISTTAKNSSGSYYYANSLAAGSNGKSVDWGMALSNNFYFKYDLFIESLNYDWTSPVHIKALYFNAGTTSIDIQLERRGTSELYMSVARAGTAITSPQYIPIGVPNTGSWFRFEVHYDATGGSGSTVLEVKIDGVTKFSKTDLTYSGTGQVSILKTYSQRGTSGSGSYTVNYYIDNVAINDGNGSTNNTWVGEESIVAVPLSGPGDGNPISAGSSGMANYSSIPPQSSDYFTVTSNPYYFTLDSSAIRPWNEIVAIGAYVYSKETSPSGSGESRYTTGIKSESNGTIQTGTEYRNSVNPPNDYFPYVSPSYSAGREDLGGAFFSDTDPTTGLPWTVTGDNSLRNAQIGYVPAEYNGAYKSVQIYGMWSTVAIKQGTAPTYAGGMLAMF